MEYTESAETRAQALRDEAATLRACGQPLYDEWAGCLEEQAELILAMDTVYRFVRGG